jgi:predicted phosphatase
MQELNMQLVQIIRELNNKIKINYNKKPTRIVQSNGTLQGNSIHSGKIQEVLGRTNCLPFL